MSTPDRVTQEREALEWIRKECALWLPTTMASRRIGLVLRSIRDKAAAALSTHEEARAPRVGLRCNPCAWPEACTRDGCAMEFHPEGADRLAPQVAGLEESDDDLSVVHAHGYASGYEAAKRECAAPPGTGTVLVPLAPHEQWPMMQRDPSAPPVAGRRETDAERIAEAMRKWLHAYEAEPGDYAGSPMEDLEIRMEGAERELLRLLRAPAPGTGEDEALRQTVVELNREVQRLQDDKRVLQETLALRAPGTGGEEATNSALVHLDDLRRLLPAREWADEAHSLVDTLTAEIEALRAPSEGTRKPGEGWRPIETAPKDGTPVLAGFYWPWVEDGDEYLPAVLLCEGGQWVDDYDTKYLAPTHWMPLPAPPIQGEEKP